MLHSFPGISKGQCHMAIPASLLTARHRDIHPAHPVLIQLIILDVHPPLYSLLGKSSSVLTFLYKIPGIHISYDSVNGRDTLQFLNIHRGNLDSSNAPLRSYDI